MAARSRKSAADAASAAELEAVYAAVVSSSLDCVVIIDEAGRVVDFNPAAEKTFGYRRDEALGREIADLIVPPNLRERHRAGLARYLATGHVTVLGRRLEIEGYCKDGRTIPVELAITEVRVPERRLFTAHIRDLTPAKVSAAELERQRDALHQTEKLAAMGSLLAGIAHELNNPLSIVLGQALLLRESVSAGIQNPDALEALSDRALRIEAAAERCARIVRSFLAIARQRKAERVQTQASELVFRATELLSYGLRTSGITVACDLPDDLPQVLVDPDQVQQIIVNLLINARQALEAHEGTRRIKISVRSNSAARMLELRVADTGPGIPEQYQARVFEPFFTTKPQGEGTGIGLAVSRGMAEAHGGSLSLESSQGGGAAFVLKLPTGETEIKPSADVELPGSGPVAQKARRHALVVDDEPEIALLLSEILARQGFTCDHAASGRAARELIRDRAIYDLVLCDMRMPDGDGPWLFRFIEKEHPSIARRIIFVTGDTLGPAAGRFLAQAQCPMIEKPFTPEDVWSVIATLEQAREEHAGA